MYSTPNALKWLANYLIKYDDCPDSNNKFLIMFDHKEFI